MSEAWMNEQMNEATERNAKVSVVMEHSHTAITEYLKFTQRVSSLEMK